MKYIKIITMFACLFNAILSSWNQDANGVAGWGVATLLSVTILIEIKIKE